MNPDINEFEGEMHSEFVPKIPQVLPMEKMYSVQVGNKCYKISGASLSSDSPSYFTSYFSKPENAEKTLFIDRSPVVFEKIILHLQGYLIEIQTPMEFVYTFSDAFYYNLPHLKEQLYLSNIFADIGNTAFKFSRKLITTKGNTPNFFTIAYQAIFRDPTTLISDMALLRPPPQAPIVLVDRCPKVFSIILSYLQGYEIDIGSKTMREKVIKECHYYRFLELEQRLIAHRIMLNPFTLQEEIVIALEHVKSKGLSLYSEATNICAMDNQTSGDLFNKTPDIDGSLRILCGPTFLKYARPHADSSPRVLVLQITGSETFLIFDKESQKVDVKFVNKTAEKLRSLLVTFVKNASTIDSFRHQHNESPEIATSLTIDALVDNNTFLKLNDVTMKENWISGIFSQQPTTALPLTVLKSQWKLQVEPQGFKLLATKLEAVTNQLNWNRQIDFL